LVAIKVVPSANLLNVKGPFGHANMIDVVAGPSFAPWAGGELATGPEVFIGQAKKAVAMKLCIEELDASRGTIGP
jgi:hypothetical protein